MSEKDFTIMHSRNMQQVSVTQRITKVLTLFITYAFLIVMALIVLFPFYWMIISSLKSLDEYRASVPTFWPRMVLISNYAEAFSTGNLGRLFLNTAYVGIVSTMLSLIITILTAFAFARLEFKGKNALFGALLATMMIPGELFTITNYQTIFMLGWQNTYTVLIVPFLVSVFYIYLLRQNFLQIPNELYLAAKVDGTSDFKYLWKVMVPLSLPTLISITILKMMGAWNSYVWPRLVANDDAHKLITNGLRNAFNSSTGETNYPVQMAAVAMVSFPLFLVFIFLRKYIMTGVSRSGRANADFDAVHPVTELDQLLPETDLLFMSLPSVSDTVNILNADRMALLPKGAYVVNVGRGTAIDQDALIKALDSDHLAGAALDVVVPEPLPADHPLRKAKNLLLTPHVAGNMTLGYTCERNVQLFCENLENYAAGRPMHHLVDRRKGY